MWTVTARSDGSRWLRFDDDGYWYADPETTARLVMARGEPVYPIELSTAAYTPKSEAERDDPFAVLIRAIRVIPGAVAEGDVPAWPEDLAALQDQPSQLVN